jgi:secreted trypsin-like serine protease
MKLGKRWFLRGIVSASLFDLTRTTCDGDNFAVYADVAQYKNWIKQETSELTEETTTIQSSLPQTPTKKLTYVDAIFFPEV